MEVSRSNAPGKKVVVVGGGPAGMEAARVASERGHNVVLFEAASKLGGQILLAAKTTWRKDLIQIVDWREAELDKLDVDVRCNAYAEASDVLAENPEHVFIATGGMPADPNLPGADLAVTSWDLLSGDVQAGQDILVCDHAGRHEAVATADMLSAKDHRVTLATIDAQAATEMGYPDRMVFHKRLAAQGVNTLAYLKLSVIRKDGNRLVATLIHELTGQTQDIVTDQVVLETGTDPLAEVFIELRDGSANNGITDVDAMADWSPQPQINAQCYTLHRLGDAVTSRSIHAALLEAYRLTVHL